MKRKSWLILCALMLCMGTLLGAVPAKGEDCFVINVDLLDMNSLRNNDYIASHLSARTAGIRVQKYISDSDELAAGVRLTIQRMDTGTLIFDKNYGYQSKTFQSGDIYLPAMESHTVPYLITLYVEDWVYAMPFMHLMPRLEHNGASTYGVRMSDYRSDLTSNWFMGTMIDLNALRIQGQTSVSLCASNAFIVGEATLSMQGEELSVSLNFFKQANVELHYAAVYCITQVAEMTSADPPSMHERAYSIGESIHVAGAQSALLYIPMSISYDSAGLSTFSYDLWGSAELQAQLSLWNENLLQSTDGAYEEPYQESADTNEIPSELENFFEDYPEDFPEISIEALPQDSDGNIPDLMDGLPEEDGESYSNEDELYAMIEESLQGE